jgi:hypothetical protein
MMTQSVQLSPSGLSILDVRILKILLGLVLAVIAIAFGVFAVAVVIAGAVIFLFARLIRRRFAGPAHPMPVAGRRPASDDVIEIEARETGGAAEGGGASRAREE